MADADKQESEPQEPDAAPAAADPPRDAPSRRPRRRRRWLWFGLPMVLLGLTVWFAPAIVARSSLRQRILPLLAPTFPGDIETGAADLDWLSPVVLRNVVLHDLEGQPLAEVAAIETSLPLWKLATHAGDVGTLRIVEPVLHVRARSDGTNIEDVITRMAADTPATDTPTSRLAVVVEVTDGRIELTNSTRGSTGVVTLPAVSIVRPPDATALTTLQAAGTLDDGERSGSYDLHVELRDDDTGLAAFDARCTTKDAPLAALTPLIGRIRSDLDVSGRLTLDARCKLATPASAPGEPDENDPSDATPVSSPPTYIASVTATATHLDLRAPGLIADDRLLLERCELGGNVRATSTEIGVRKLLCVSDIGRVAFDGTIPLDDATDPATLSGLTRLATRHRHVLDATVDLRTLVAVLPETTRVRDDLHLDTGSVRLVSSSAAKDGRRAWTVQAGVRNLSGRISGTDVRWDEPLHAAIRVPVTERGPAIDRLQLRADFARVDGRRSDEGVELSLGCDLDQLRRKLEEFVDLGDIELAGRITGTGAIVEEANDRWTARLDLDAERYLLSWPNRPRWSEPKLTIAARAIGRLSDDRTLERLETGSLVVAGGADRLELRLTDSVAWNPDPSAIAWPLAYELRGAAEQWQTRLGPFVDLDGWTAKGDTSISGTGTFAADRVLLASCKGDVRSLDLTGPGFRLVEPKLTIDATGEWDGKKSFVAAPKAVVVARTAAVRAIDLRCDWSSTGAPKMTGALALRADLARTQRVIGREPVVYGDLTGSLKFQHEAPVTKSLWNLSVANLRTTAATLLPPDPAPVTLTGRIDYHHAKDILAIRSANLGTTGLSARVTGRTSALTTAPLADITGDLTYDWRTLAPRLREYLGTIDITGTGTRSIALKGPLDFSKGLPPTLVASGGLGWQSIDAYGVPVGPGALDASASNGRATFAPLDVVVAGGRLRTTPHIASLQSGSVLTLSPNTTLTDVQLTPELTSQWLGYATPLLANGTTAEGRLSASLARTSVPLANWQAMDAAGQLVIDEARVAPGPMGSQLIAIVEQVRSIATGGGIAAPRNVTLDASQQTVNVQVTRGRVFHDQFTVRVSGVPVKTSGSVGFDNTLDLVAELSIPDEWTGDNAVGKALTGKLLRIPIRGTTSAPQIDNSIVTNLAAQIGLDSVRDRLGDALNGPTKKLNDQTKRLNDEIGRGLDRIFGPR